MKKIILYYSKSGVTEKLAKRIQGDLDCDIIKIEAEDPYGNYFSSLARVNKERRNKVPVKAINEIPDLTDYDVVFIGYPIWYLDVPFLVSDFIGKCNLESKTVIPFSTSGLGNIKATIDTLKKSCPKSNIIAPLQWGIAKKDDYPEWLGKVKSI